MVIYMYYNFTFNMSLFCIFPLSFHTHLLMNAIMHSLPLILLFELNINQLISLVSPDTFQTLPMIRCAFAMRVQCRN